MKNFILISLFVSSYASADVTSKLSEFNQFIDEQEGDAPICQITEQLKPVIKKGEVKISYPCESFNAPAEVEKEKISFYDSPELEEKGIIFRTRTSESGSDATVKFRPKIGELLLDKAIYGSLDVKTKDLKCEADVSLNKRVDSCSITTETDVLTEDHTAFLKMVDAGDVPTELSKYKKYEIDSTSWKIRSPLFVKGISFEKWEMKKGEKSLCILEVSAKFEVKKEPAADIEARLDAEIKKSLASLSSSFPDVKPDSVQGNKTGRAFEFLK
jgi:hypothetical protein